MVSNLKWDPPWGIPILHFESNSYQASSLGGKHHGQLHHPSVYMLPDRKEHRTEQIWKWSKKPLQALDFPSTESWLVLAPSLVGSSSIVALGNRQTVENQIWNSTDFFLIATLCNFQILRLLSIYSAKCWWKGFLTMNCTNLQHLDTLTFSLPFCVLMSLQEGI